VGGLRHQSRSDLGNTPASAEMSQGPRCGARAAVRTRRSMYRPSVPSRAWIAGCASRRASRRL